MSFELTNALATFKKMMKRIFNDHQDFKIIFFDDILVFIRSSHEHEKHIHAIFNKLHEINLYANPC